MSDTDDQRRRRMAAVVERHGGEDASHDGGGLPEVDPSRRYLLVERDRQSEGTWFTSHESPADAGDYSANQEYAEAWEPLELVDLDTGERFRPEITVAWRSPWPAIFGKEQT
jgi:hypothetical protein